MLASLPSAAWDVLLALSPWLLLGAAVAGAMHSLLPASFVSRQLRGRAGVWKAVAFGVPLPLCSCGVIPAGLSLKKQGASDGAAVGFLISTPQTGVDSILVSASFLGWPFALFKVASAFALGLAGGMLTDAVVPAGDAAAGEGELALEHGAGSRTLRAAVDHALMLVRTIWGWVAFGVLASAALTTLVPADAFAGLAAYGGALAMGAVLALSVPLYVCATASVPIAAALVASGFPPGAALVFLMAGPATNVATLGAVSRTFGRRALLVYLGTIVVGSVGLGLAFEWVLPTASAAAAHHSHVHGEGAPWAVASSVALVALFAWFAATDLGRLLRRLRPPAPAVATVEVSVSGITCGACVRRLEGALGKEQGVSGVEVSKDAGLARVTGTVGRDRICQIIRDAGYEPREA